jgi:3-hydroxyisobutyrate dehydrogenase-like beta-hydroxyacid dehydrogenase
MAVTLSFGRREALAFSQTMLFDSLLARLAVAAFVASNRDKIAKGDYETEFPLRWMRKDMHLESVSERQLPISRKR